MCYHIMISCVPTAKCAYKYFALKNLNRAYCLNIQNLHVYIITFYTAGDRGSIIVFCLVVVLH